MTTKIECEEQIKKQECVCDRCGRELEAIETVDNSGTPTFWSGCRHGGAWGHFTGGVRKETFELAEKLVCNGERTYHLDAPKTNEEKINWFQSQVSGVCLFLNHAECLKNNPPRKTKEEFIKSL
jgi:hypothetical protein